MNFIKKKSFSHSRPTLQQDAVHGFMFLPAVLLLLLRKFHQEQVKRLFLCLSHLTNYMIPCVWKALNGAECKMSCKT